jgi:Ca2+-binding RTX toxin-like protein
MLVETLERRQLLSVSIFLSNNTLTVLGDSADNRISVEHVPYTGGGAAFVYNDTGGGHALLGGYDLSAFGILSIQTRGGNDAVTVAAGITKLVSVYGGSGNDYIQGGGGWNFLFGNSASDSGASNETDVLVGRYGATNRLYGGRGNDVITAGGFSDIAEGGEGNDALMGPGMGGAATLRGNSGSDTFYMSDGVTRVDGGSGTDLVNYSAFSIGMVIKLDGGWHSGTVNYLGLHRLGTDVENVVGGRGGDAIYGTSAANDIRGGDGNDRLYGNAGNDTVRGGAGNDSLSGMDGADVLYGETGNDTLDGGAHDDDLYGYTGHDSLRGGSGDDNLFGDTGNDTLSGDSGDDYATGAAGHDSILGGDGDDSLYGAAGNDIITGGLGIDTLIGGDGADVLDSVDNHFGDKVYGYLPGNNNDGDFDIAHVNRGRWWYDQGNQWVWSSDEVHGIEAVLGV